MTVIVFETGSADWVNLERESGFVKSAHDATLFPDKKCAEIAIIADSRYKWLYDKGALEFQNV